ncbi:hypothetical protein [Marinoscillum furvescens]|uniref:hypothetical protein n=1 Tax=Marinoscillum furvescens TaxID=1026 RepID=UPI001C870DA7|nr:hypothetical protein [Marinoscillum furvescens]
MPPLHLFNEEDRISTPVLTYQSAPLMALAITYVVYPSHGGTALHGGFKTGA